eukprot:15225302-Alexandrium_andersonii.AAC.1
MQARRRARACVAQLYRVKNPGAGRLQPVTVVVPCDGATLPPPFSQRSAAEPLGRWPVQPRQRGRAVAGQGGGGMHRQPCAPRMAAVVL